MGNFDQRGQHVATQTNIVGGQNYIHTTQVEGDWVQGDKVHGNKNVFDMAVMELQSLLRQVHEATQLGDLDLDTAEDVEHSLKKAAIEAKKEQPDSSKCLAYMDKARTYLDKMAGVSKSAAALVSTVTAVYTKIAGWF